MKFDVVILPGNGNFNVLENGENLTASGKITVIDADEERPFFYGSIDDYPPNITCERIELGTADIYKEFLLRGYE